MSCTLVPPMEPLELGIRVLSKRLDICPWFCVSIDVCVEVCVNECNFSAGVSSAGGRGVVWVGALGSKLGSVSSKYM